MNKKEAVIKTRMRAIVLLRSGEFQFKKEIEEILREEEFSYIREGMKSIPPEVFHRYLRKN